VEDFGTFINGRALRTFDPSVPVDSDPLTRPYRAITGKQNLLTGTSPPNPTVMRETVALIMKGGSVKGLAYIGAPRELEKYYDFDWFIGTSADAIAAVLLAAGYSAEHLSPNSR